MHQHPENDTKSVTSHEDYNENSTTGFFWEIHITTCNKVLKSIELQELATIGTITDRRSQWTKANFVTAILSKNFLHNQGENNPFDLNFNEAD